MLCKSERNASIHRVIRAGTCCSINWKLVAAGGGSSGLTFTAKNCANCGKHLKADIRQHLEAPKHLSETSGEHLAITDNVTIVGVHF